MLTQNNLFVSSVSIGKQCIQLLGVLVLIFLFSGCGTSKTGAVESHQSPQVTFRKSMTEKNLVHAYLMETRNARQYQIYAQCAVAEKKTMAAKCFNHLAAQDNIHAEVLLNALKTQGGVSDIKIGFHPTACLTTEENLNRSVDDATDAWLGTYETYKQTAHREGYAKLAELFDGLSNVDRMHEFRLKTALYKINQNMYDEAMPPTAFRDMNFWECHVCGYLTDDKTPPPTCPFCSRTGDIWDEFYRGELVWR